MEFYCRRFCIPILAAVRFSKATISGNFFCKISFTGIFSLLLNFWFFN